MILGVYMQYHNSRWQQTVNGIGFNPFYAELLYPGKYKLFVCLSVSDTYMCVKIDTSLLYTLFYKKNQLLILCMAEH